nr:acyltransferase [uncultured Albidiferax sp.]
MTASFSLYLDLIRFLASLAVFFDHLASREISGGVIPTVMGIYGQAAVTIFFLLSGYVISFVVQSREKEFKIFAINRVARLYSVILIALPLTLIFDALGMHFSPVFYEQKKILSDPESLAGYLTSFFFINEYKIFGVKGLVAGTNGPLWSLSFEATYYVACGLLLFAKRWVAVALVLLMLACAGPTITVLATVWLLGWALHRSAGNSIFRMKSRFARIMFFVSVVGLIIAPLVSRYLPYDNFGLFFPFGRNGSNRNILQDIIVSSFFALNIISAKVVFDGPANVKDGTQNLIKRLGALTFPLYCIHFPLMCLLAATAPFAHGSLLKVIYITILCLCFIIFVTPACDQLKLWIRKALKGSFLAAKPA